MKRYARLYLAKNNRDNLAAGRLLEKSISISPLDEELFGLLRQVRGGTNYEARSGNDWFIRFSEPYAKKYPSNIKLCHMLIEAMIEMRYFDRALDMIETMRAADNSTLTDIFNGDIEFARGNIEAAIAIWDGIDKKDHLLQYEVGERYNRLCEYDKAIECFENSYEASPSPKRLDSIYSLAFLYTKLGKYNDAIAMWEAS